MIRFRSYRKKNKLESYKKVCQNEEFCNAMMPSEDTKILQFDQFKKSDKASVTTYADLEFINKETDGFKNNLEYSSTTDVGEHIPLNFANSATSSFASIEIKHDVYRGKDCLEHFCELLRDQAMKMINFKKKENQVSYSFLYWIQQLLSFYHKKVNRRIKNKQFNCLAGNTKKYITLKKKN